MVLDPAEAGQTPPDGTDVVLLCGPSSSASLAFANSGDPAQLQAFRDAAADAELIAAGQSDESCAAAIAEMLTAVTVDDGEAKGSTPATAVKQEEAEEWEAALGLERQEEGSHPSESISRNKAKKEKRSKKEKREKREKRDKKERHKSPHRSSSQSRRQRARSDSESEARDSSSDDDNYDGNYENGVFDAPRHTRRKRERQTQMEEYDMGLGTDLDYIPRENKDYYYQKLRNSRRVASLSELQQLATEIRSCISRCLSNVATYQQVEDEMLRWLRQLTSLDVTVDHLQKSGIGVAVGSLLHSFTVPVVQLAQAILQHWFYSLPKATQQDLSTTSELDRCSLETCSDGVAGEHDLGPIGIEIYDSYTNEEINDAPSSVDVMALCQAIEEALDKNCDSDTQMLALSAFTDTTDAGKSLRRLVVQGKIVAMDIVKHVSDLPGFVRQQLRRPSRIQLMSPTSAGDAMLSPTSPYEPFSPNDGDSTANPTFGSPTGKASTTLYSCPHCGANDAYQSSYSVQAHDNMPDILTCKKCGQTWNVGGQ